MQSTPAGCCCGFAAGLGDSLQEAQRLQRGLLTMGHFVCAELLVASMYFSHVKHFGSIPDLSAATKMEGIMVAMQTQNPFHTHPMQGLHCDIAFLGLVT